ncbi:MAG TPA: GNAT family N-acetyltransferase [Streptosporangiaceae bacterium]|nr:GNAT family N-acetyltransferase [Streptosporangiaceae bacterium]
MAFRDGPVIREARPDEMPAVGELRVAAYSAGGFLSSPDTGYALRLRTLGTDSRATIFVAVEPGGEIVGTIMLQCWPDAEEVVTAEGEAEIRALAVAPGAQRGGVGRQLLTALVDRAASLGVQNLLLCTLPEMRAAHRLYEQAGFRRLPERDWSPRPDIELLVYALPLGKAAGVMVP